MNNVGLTIWQNDDSNHLIEDCTIENCRIGILHGAYRQGYHYKKVRLINCLIGAEIHALPHPNAPARPDGYKSSFEDCDLGTVVIKPHTLPGDGPILFLRCNIDRLIIDQLPARVPNPPGGRFDFVFCQPFFVDVKGWQQGTVIRLQYGTFSYECTDGVNWVEIGPFYH